MTEKMTNEELAKANARIAELERALFDLHASAVTMYASINASNPEFIREGLPGWVIGCKQSIDRAACALKDTDT